ncbi:MAG: carboxypeptidase-like regulatory domain-containing protein, partial [Muribaculaceae bacterium]|nr:carboxypeptidase-like regulatory domain-containing protein [Muribaculaceae bacterium]
MQSKLRNIFMGLAFTVPFFLYAKGDISGTVINKQTGEPMDFVNVQLVTSKGVALPIGTSTDSNGKFTIKNVADGSYIVKITNIGSIEQE